MRLVKHLFYLMFIVLNSDLKIFCKDSYICQTPERCRFENVFNRDGIDINEKGNGVYLATMCDIDNDWFDFKYKHETTSLNNSQNNKCHKLSLPFHFIFRWT